MNAALSYMLKYMISFLFFYVVFSYLADAIAPYDATDDIHNKVRSNMSLLTDHGTGCQYLGSLFGPPTPRLDRNGKHICN